MYHKNSDSLEKLFPDLFMIVLLPFYSICWMILAWPDS